MLCFKPIRVFTHVWSDWPVPLWRGWPHASLSPILRTIWQWGVFFSHSLFVSLQSDWFLFHFFISSVSEYLYFHSFFLFLLLFMSFTLMAPALASTLSFLCYFKGINLPSVSEIIKYGKKCLSFSFSESVDPLKDKLNPIVLISFTYYGTFTYFMFYYQ